MKTMANIYLRLLVVGAIAVIAPVVSSGAILVVVDELGTGGGTFVSGFPFGNGPIVGLPMLDPSTGLTTVHYSLPVAVTNGDLILTESVMGVTKITEVLRFKGSDLWFYSDREETEPNLPADVGTTFQTVGNFIRPEGDSPTEVVAKSGNPGFAGDDTTYRIYSDCGTGVSPADASTCGDVAVPEPSSIVALSTILLGTVAFGFRRSNSRFH